MRICAVVLVAMLASSSCSLVFRDADPSQAQECVGVQRSYERGELVVANRYSRIDYRQGTLTFWVRALGPIETATPLVSLAGIAAIAFADGMRLSIGGATIKVPILDPLWDVGTEHFVVLRWDTIHALSGTNGSQMELRMDGEVYNLDTPVPFTVTPNSDDPSYLVIGDSRGSVHVDQVVIYDRPIFVSDVSQEESELDRPDEKRISPRIADGGFDVLFATVSPKDSGCDDYAAEAWAFADDDQLEGSLKLAPAMAGIPVPPTLLDGEDQVYPGGGIRVDSSILDGDSKISVAVTGGGSYVLELLTHSLETAAVPLVDVEFVVTGSQLIHHEGEASTREDPLRSILTFQVPAMENEVVIRMGSLDGPVAFDSITLRPNLFVEAGFEEEEMITGDTWALDDAGGTITKTYLPPMEAYAGQTSICLQSPGSPAVVHQEPKTRSTNKALMADHSLYLFGGQFLWRDGAVPSVNIGNGSLFATGGPYDRESKAGTSALEEGKWHNVSSVGRRLLDSQHNNHNDIIRFGTGYNRGSSDFCLDSAYNIKLDRIIGLDVADN